MIKSIYQIHSFMNSPLMRVGLRKDGLVVGGETWMMCQCGWFSTSACVCMAKTGDCQPLIVRVEYLLTSRCGPFLVLFARYDRA
ncbi:hypothetical protein FKM82_007822 [Ascaphus truei]